MARLNPTTIAPPIKGYYEKAVQILEQEKPKLGNDFNNLSGDVDDLFSVASKKLQKTTTQFKSRRFSPFGPRKILGGANNTKMTPVSVGLSLEEKQKIIKNLSKGMKSVADAMHSENMTLLANALAKANMN